MVKKIIYNYAHCKNSHLLTYVKSLKSFVNGLWCYIGYYLSIVWKWLVVHYFDRFCVRKLFLFRWNKVPGIDSDRFIEYLKENIKKENYETEIFNVDWIKRAKIIHPDNGRSIKIHTPQNNMSLEMNSEKTKVELKINDTIIDGFFAHSKNNDIYIYKNLNTDALVKYIKGLSIVGTLTIIILIVPLFIEFGSQYLFEYPTEHFITNATSAQYILSALAQSQAAIIAIVFTALLIICQMTIALDPKHIIDLLTQKGAIILIILYGFSIVYDLILLTMITEVDTKVNVFAPILLILFLIVFLFSGIVKLVRFMHKKVIADTARTGAHKYLVELDLGDAFLANAKLSKAKLTKSFFNSAQLQDADLTDADMSKTKLTGVNLKNAILSGANLMEAELSNCDLSSVDLRGSKLVRAQFIGTTIKKVNFSGADLSKAEMHKYLFSWDDLLVSNFNEFKKFIVEYLKMNCNIRCVPCIRIKIDSDKSIRVDTKKKQLSVSLISEKNKVELKIDGKVDTFIVNTENDKLNVYESNTICDCRINGANLSNACMESIIFDGSKLNGANFTPLNLDDAEYLFSWNEVPRDDKKLIDFLKEEFDIDSVKFEKNDDNNTIKLDAIKDGESRHFLLEPNTKKTKVNLKMNDIIIYEFIVKTEDDKLHICKNIRTNLKYADLKDISLNGANLRYVDLSGADLRNAVLKGADLSYAILRNAKLEGTQMHGAKIFGAQFNPKTNFYKLGLSKEGVTKGKYIDRNLGEVEVDRGDFSEQYSDQYIFNWDECPSSCYSLVDFLYRKYKLRWIKRADIKKIDDGNAICISNENKYVLLELNDDKTLVKLKMYNGVTDGFFIKVEDFNRNVYTRFNFDGSEFTNTNFCNSKLAKSKLSGCVLTNSNFIKTDFTKSMFNGTQMENVDLTEANLIEAELNGANLSSAILIGADLSGAYLNGARLDNAIMCATVINNITVGAFQLGDDDRLYKPNLKGVNLHKAELNGASLVNANLMGADLSEATLSGTNLEGANLRGADLRGTDFCGANIDNAEFRDTIQDKETNFGGSTHPVIMQLIGDLNP